LTLAEKYGVQADLVQAVDRVNQYQNQHLVDVVLREMEKVENKTVGVLGLAFTSNTPVVTESPAIKLISELLKHDIRVVAYDPLAIDNARTVFGSAVEYVHSAERCLSQAGLVVVTLRSPELKRAVEGYTPNHPLTVVDCWRMVEPRILNARIRYIPLGRCNSEK